MTKIKPEIEIIVFKTHLKDGEYRNHAFYSYRRIDGKDEETVDTLAELVHRDYYNRMRYRVNASHGNVGGRLHGSEMKKLVTFMKDNVGTLDKLVTSEVGRIKKATTRKYKNLINRDVEKNNLVCLNSNILIRGY